jgi:hypothetical protein
MLDGGMSVILTHHLYLPIVDLPIVPYRDIGASHHVLDLHT